VFIGGDRVLRGGYGCLEVVIVYLESVKECLEAVMCV